MRFYVLVSVFGFAFSANFALAQDAAGNGKPAQPAFSESGLDWLRMEYSKRLNREPYGWSLTQVERQFAVVFDAARISGADAISAQDEKLAGDIQRAQSRASAIRQVLAADVNGDGKVTRDEVRTALRFRYMQRTEQHRDARMQREFDRILANDRNRDGTITLDEVIESDDARALLRGSSLNGSGRIGTVPMTLDRDGDGLLTRQEFLDAVRVVFGEIDRNDDRKLDDDEMRRLMDTVRQIRQRQMRERRQTFAAQRIARQIMRCSFPPLPDRTKLVFAAAYRGQALANVSIKGKQQLMTAAQVEIEPGADPLTLVLSAGGNMIWQITGATERVAKVLVGSRFSIGGKSTDAVAGVAAEKVHFVTTSNCLPTSFRGDAERKHVSAALRTALRVEPDAVVSAPSARKVSFPSGKVDDGAANPNAVAPPKDSPASALWKAVERTFPAGIVRFDPNRIVSQESLTAEPVLPGRAGLAQLIDQGALELPPAQAGSAPFPIPELRIVGAIHMPTGLSQAIVRKFVLAKGAKTPEGLHPRLCVVNEADGKPVPGSGSCGR